MRQACSYSAGLINYFLFFVFGFAPIPIALTTIFISFGVRVKSGSSRIVKVSVDGTDACTGSIASASWG
jgi:hypothetical protein